MNKEEICYLPAYEMKEKITSQELSSSEITETIIERIKRVRGSDTSFFDRMFNSHGCLMGFFVKMCRSLIE